MHSLCRYETNRSEAIVTECTALAESLYRRGVLLWGEGQADAAVAALDEALRVKCDFPAALSMAAFILGASGKRSAAISFYRRALEIENGDRVSWANLGKLLFEEQRFAEALDAFEAASKIAPEEPDNWNNLAGALRELGRLTESANAAAEALRLWPEFAEAALNLGNAFLKLDRMEEALVAYERAIAIRPGFGVAHCGKALVLKSLERFEEALEAFDVAEGLGCEEAAAGRGCLQLMLGEFAAGWEGYEARWLNGRSLSEALGVRYRKWRGLCDPARRVLVLNDHGFGDTIQFSRYVRLMASSGLDVTFVCPRQLHRLLSSLRVRLVEQTPEHERFDAQIAVSSLPRAFETRLDGFLPNGAYLEAEPELCTEWTARVGGHGFKIGLVWQGNPSPKADMARSFPLSAAASLAQVQNVRLLSLQKGFGSEQLMCTPPEMKIERFERFDEGANAFVDTAAIVTSLDLVVCCDTSVAHLAGALGRPVWVALKKDAEWRWLLEREDSPWYPSMRLFRQRRRGDWAGVFEHIRNALTEMEIERHARTA